MNDCGLLYTTAIAFERALIECFNFNINGIRIRGWIISFVIICYAIGSNLDAIFGRNMSDEGTGPKVCKYNIDQSSIWRRFDVIFYYIHTLCSIGILTTIARRKIFIHSTKHRDFFIPPICLILCITPHGLIGHLLPVYLPYSNLIQLRLHIFTMFLLFTTQI